MCVHMFMQLLPLQWLTRLNTLAVLKKKPTNSFELPVKTVGISQPRESIKKQTY